jgi:hypothetical protein
MRGPVPVESGYDQPIVHALRRIIAACLCLGACADPAQEPPLTCDGTEQCTVNTDGTCSPCCCPIPGTEYYLTADLTCTRDVRQGTLDCYARAGTSDDFPDICGSAPATQCLQRSDGESLDVRELPFIPIGWSQSEWTSCTAEASAAIRSASACE